MKDSPHDKLFKEAFGNPHNAAAEIRSVAPPALVAHMDFASLIPLPGSFRDAALADSSSDLLFSLRIAGRDKVGRAPDGRRALMVLSSYLSRVLAESAWPKVQSVVDDALPETEETLMTTMAERWLKEGEQRGLEQGQRTLLLEQL